MRLNPTAFNTFINKIGQDVLWRKSLRCPCRNKRSGSPNPDCLVCYGLGYTYESPVSGIIGTSGMSIQRAWSSMGLYESGDQVITIGNDSPLYGVSNGDRVLLINSSIPFEVNLDHTGTEIFPYSFESIQSIAKVFWISGSSYAYSTIAINSTTNRVEWTANEPSINTQYTVLGRRNPEYYAYMDYPVDRSHFHGLPLPRRIVLRNYEVARRFS